MLLEIKALRAEIEGLREDLEHAMRRMLDRDDRRIGSVLVPLLGELFPTEQFAAADVAALALNDRTATGEALRELIGDGFLTEEGGLRAFGRLLGRLEGVRFGSWRLSSRGRRQGVARWVVSTRQKPPTDAFR